MPEVLLDGSDVNPAFDCMNGMSVPKCMRGDTILFPTRFVGVEHLLYPGCFSNRLDDFLVHSIDVNLL